MFQRLRIDMYWPFLMRSSSAALITGASPLFLGIAMPYGAKPYDLPTSLNCPFDCLTRKAATGESAIPTCARPLESARLAPFWSGKVRTFAALAPHFLLWASASACCVVPSRPHRLPAQVGERVDRWAALGLDVERRAGREVGHEVDRVLALLRVGERRHPDVVRARREAGYVRRNRSVPVDGLQPHLGHERLG